MKRHDVICNGSRVRHPGVPVKRLLVLQPVTRGTAGMDELHELYVSTCMEHQRYLDITGKYGALPVSPHQGPVSI